MSGIDDIWHALDQYYKVAPRTAARAQFAFEQLLLENATLKVRPITTSDDRRLDRLAETRDQALRRDS